MHAYLVVLPVSRRLPQLGVIHVRGEHLRVPARPILAFDEVRELVVDARAVGQPEGRARRQVMEEEQLLLHTHLYTFQRWCICTGVHG